MLTQGRNDDAEIALKEELKRNPLNHRALFLLCQIEGKRGEYIKAFQHCMESYRVFPDDEYIIYSGDLLFEGGYPLPAFEIFSSVLREFPENITLTIKLGNTLLRMNKFKEAELIYRLALNIKEDERAYHNLAIALWMDGRREDAIKTFERYISMCTRCDDAEEIRRFLNENTIPYGKNKNGSE